MFCRSPENGANMEEGGSTDVPLKSSSEMVGANPTGSQNSCIIVDEEPLLTSTADQRKPVATSGMRCPYCRYLCGSRFSFQIHVGSRHPLLCDAVPVGRLGKVVFYQPTAELFHCHICFFTSKDYAVVFQHLLARHCPVEPADKQPEEPGKAEPEENPLKRKRSSMSENVEEPEKRTGEEHQHRHHVHPHHMAQRHQCPYCSFQASLRDLSDHLTHCRVQEGNQEQ